MRKTSQFFTWIRPFNSYIALEWFHYGEKRKQGSWNRFFLPAHKEHFLFFFLSPTHFGTLDMFCEYCLKKKQRCAFNKLTKSSLQLSGVFFFYQAYNKFSWQNGKFETHVYIDSDIWGCPTLSHKCLLDLSLLHLGQIPSQSEGFLASIFTGDHHSVGPDRTRRGIWAWASHCLPKYVLGRRALMQCFKIGKIY